MSDTALVVIVLLLAFLFAAIVIIGLLGYMLFNLKKRLARYQGITDLEAEQAKVKGVTQKLHEKNEGLQAEQVKLKQEEEKIREAITKLRAQLGSLEGDLELQSYGLYEPKYDFGTSERYKSEIEVIRQRQKQMIQTKKAVVCGTEWTVGGSKTEGRRMVDQQTKLMLRAFNGESDSLILKVKYNNIHTIEERIKSVYEAINKLGKTQNCWISPEYFNLKLEELRLVHEYQEKLNAEREEQRQIRERMREEELVQRELEKAQQEAEKEEKRYQQALEQARREIEMATGEKHDKLQANIEQLQRLLKEAHEKKQRALARAQMTKSGHVYIISNIGSFGEHVYKIGMTRRLDPEDRIRELGDASVPFPFDIHAVIFCEDAPALENKLHRLFESKRVNWVNQRKEFFIVGLDEIEKVVRQHHGQIEFTLVAEAEEYRKTQAMMVEKNGKSGEMVFTKLVSN